MTDKKKQGQQEREGQQGNVRPDRGQRGQGLEAHRPDEKGNEGFDQSKQKNKDFEKHQEGQQAQETFEKPEEDFE